MWNSLECNDIRQMETEQVPNYYITGKSIPAMEKAALKLADEIEDKELISFKGIVKHFTIKMPYHERKEDSENFLKRLKESVSIARDCYGSYSGIILIECSEVCAEQKEGRVMDLLLDYIRDNEQICFILLVPVTDKNKNSDQLFCRLLQFGAWFRIHSQTPTVQQCLSYFQSAACEQGYEVSEDACLALSKHLESRNEMRTENIEVVRRLIRQVAFERQVTGNADRVIHEQDVVCARGSEEKKTHKRIGFVTENHQEEIVNV